MSEVGYFQLLKSNRKFRFFWSAAIISMLGEWFNTIAIFTILLSFTGSEALLGLLFTIRLMSFALLQPIIGLLADRWQRKSIMIWSNLIQVGLALCFLLVDGPEDMWWMLALNGIMMILHGAYMTAERAALPNIVSDDELATANALDSATWSFSLAIGAALGGFVVSEYGTDWAFIIDSVTFLLGTLLILPVVIPQKISKEMQGPLFSTAFSNIKAGWVRTKNEARLFRIIFAKASWNIAGGGLAAVYLVLAGSSITNIEMAAGMGLFYMARGIGTGIGPIFARKVFLDEKKWPGLVGILVAASGILYFFVGLSLELNLFIILFLIITAHAASGANWVLSTILTQKWVEDEMRGRVFSMDMILMSLSFSISTLIAGALLEYNIFSLKEGMLIFASVMVVAGILFTLWRPDKASASA
ncbi:MAG: MFS transporter [Candidatus Poseidoniaceae archaeon]|nr:MFS transporter [Candidatus Poseidoniaceae archaeon]